MNILIIGNGGREHALAWKVAQSPLAKKVFVAPGNAGTALENSLENVNIAATDISELIKFAKYNNIDFTIVGPEASLVIGIVDMFHDAGLIVFGPTKAAAQLEGSKNFTKNFLHRHNIPTGCYQNFKEVLPAINYVHKKGVPIVIKADGLAAGKGVIIATTLVEAEDAIKKILISKIFGESGNSIVIEEFISGEEISFIVMVDGKNVVPMATSQDYKRVGDGDNGLNTGGMGAYSPVPLVTNELYNKILDQIILPTIKGMARENNSYTGFLYAGLIITPEGQPKVIEFNCRLGDPETQTIILRMRSDLLAHCIAATKCNLDKEVFQWDERFALSVVLASVGYPSNYRIGYEISGLPTIDSNEEKVFHSGTLLEKGKLLTNSGRVLCVTTLGNTLAEAQKRTYKIVDCIKWQDSFCRRDIGYRAGLVVKSN
ncbi:phosphoribosylamine--glycine ligase [Candidatus Palibaumannia cicadellinicola]|uniref:Phosphoribosylamine--glycine ligase n=1 Tax=Candidatus Palibaumannia cicadellinicola TaxID=186490 RepID=A0A0K2BK04_9GAMM|nr:phosphoribosylamine--glycine ligase [Candidatus Baumannia cicadellinicola]AKZ65660.1 Phosphoribosylamine--glycine ligase [Candidatus Baumannia cicadellinicola]